MSRKHDWRETLLTSLIYHETEAYETSFVAAKKIVKSVTKYIVFLKTAKEKEILKIWTQLIHTYALRNPDRQRILQPFLKDIVMNIRPELQTASERNLALAQWKLLYLAAKGHEENIEILREAKASEIASRHLKHYQKLKSSVYIKQVINLLKIRTETELVPQPSGDNDSSPSLLSQKRKKDLSDQTENSSEAQIPMQVVTGDDIEEGDGGSPVIDEQTNNAKVQGSMENNRTELTCPTSQDVWFSADHSERDMETDTNEIGGRRSSSDEYFTAQDRLTQIADGWNRMETEEQQAFTSDELNQNEITEQLQTEQQSTGEEAKRTPVKRAETSTDSKNGKMSPGRIILDQIVAKVRLKNQEKILRAEILARRRSLQQ